MRKVIPMLAVAVLFAGVTLMVRADEKKTIVGEAQCAKCALKETKSCQNVIVVKEDGKDVKYYIADNEVAQKAHKALGVCSAKPGEGPKLQAEGTVKEEDGKMVMTATKIEPVEE